MLAGRPAGRNVVLRRIFTAAFGCTAVIWGLTTLPIFWRQSTLERTAQEIINGEPFKVEVLAGDLPLIETIEKTTFCRPAALRSAAIIRIRIAEEGRSEGVKEKSDAQMNAATDSVRESLSCSPADPFLWLALYWLDSTQHGLRPEDLKYLELSYQLGPNEGWIALKRNSAAFGIFQQLPSNLAELAINEFVGLLKAGFYEQAAEIFTGPAWPERGLILPHLASIAKLDRQRFWEALYRRGYDVNVPGVARRESPPWQ